MSIASPAPPPESKTCTLHEFFYDGNGAFQHRVHEATLARAPRDTLLWFKRPGCRAFVSEKNLDRPRNGRYYTLTDNPDAAKIALWEQMESNRKALVEQLEKLNARMALIWEVNGK